MPNNKKLYSERFTVLITKEEKKQMLTIAEKENKAASEILRIALKKYLEKNFVRTA